jgi:hypothetical protein
MSTIDNEKILKEVEQLRGPENIIIFALYKIFQTILGLASVRLTIPCLNKGFVNKISDNVRKNGISSKFRIETRDITRVTCCSLLHNCPECTAIGLLKKLFDLPEGENALLDPELCEKVGSCVLEGAGIFGYSLLFHLIQTSPYFREKSLILFALENRINKENRIKNVEIAEMFFKATKEFRFFIEAPRQSNTELRKMELELCRTVYAADIARIREENAVAEAAALEERKRQMPTCCFCNGDPIDNPPILSPTTCEHEICCMKCFHTGLKHEYKCPLCQVPLPPNGSWVFKFV